MSRISPQRYARLGGLLYLIVIVIGFAGEFFVRGRILVPGNEVATAANLRAMEPLWRVGIALESVSLLCVVGLALAYYVLLNPVNREINLLATFLRLIGVAIEAVATLNLANALFPLANTAALQTFTSEQLAAMARMAIRAQGYGFAMALLFTGVTFLFHGYLIAKSRFLPAVLGWLIQIAGVAYITNTLALFLNPAVADQLFPFILLPPLIAETALSLWLLMKGVNVDKWRAAAAGHGV